jgi:hypothetical protein
MGSPKCFLHHTAPVTSRRNSIPERTKMAVSTTSEPRGQATGVPTAIGCPPETIAHALTRKPDGTATTIAGAILDLILAATRNPPKE